MRLFEITEPDPAHARLARRAAETYERLYTGTFDALRRFPPRGGLVVPERRAVIFRYDDLLGRREPATGTWPVFERVASVLARLGWTTDPDLYLKGIAKRSVKPVLPGTPKKAAAGAGAGSGRPERPGSRETRMSIGRILSRALADERALAEAGLSAEEVLAAKKAFENDPHRRGVAAERRGEERVIVVSFDPLEAAHMTALRKWRSCWRIGGAEERRFREALQCGIATAWLTTRDDVEAGKWIDSPTARWLVVPYVDPSSRIAVALRPVLDSYHVYGTPPPDAHRAVSEALARIEDSLYRAFGPREGRKAVSAVRADDEETVVLAPADHPARVLHALLTRPPERWRLELNAARIRNLRFDDGERLAAQLESVGIAEDVAREVADALAHHRRPHTRWAADAVLVLAAFGVVPPDAVPAPETFGDRLCDLLRAIADIGGPDPGTAIRRIWRGDDAKVAAIVAGVRGCAQKIDDVTLPGREEALRLLERALAHASRGLRWELERLAETLRAGRVTRPVAGRARADDLALRILFAERGPREIEPAEALLAPDEVLRAFPSGLRPETELAARLARALDRILGDERTASADLAALVRGYGREAVTDMLRLARETAAATKPRPPWSIVVSSLSDLLGTGRGERRVRDWPVAFAALDAGLVEPDDLLRAAGPEDLAALAPLADRDGARRLRDVLPLAVASAVLEDRDPLDALRFLGRLEPHEIPEALETVAERGAPEVAERAREVLAIVRGEARPDPGSPSAMAAVYLAVLGLVDPALLAGVLDRDRWRGLALLLRHLPGPQRDRLLDVLARSEPAIDALYDIPRGYRADLARRMARYGTRIRWGARGRHEWIDHRRLVDFTAAHAAAGGEIPADLGTPEPPAIAMAAETVGGHDRPPVSGWVRAYARELADAIEREGPRAAVGLVHDVRLGLLPHATFEAILSHLPLETARILRARARRQEEA